MMENEVKIDATICRKRCRQNRCFLVVIFEAWGSKNRSFPKRPDLENQAKTMEGWSKIDFRMGRFWAKGRRKNVEIRHQFW